MKISEFEYKRLRNRVKSWNYSENGYYFVTVNTHNFTEWFGEVKNREMVLNEWGKIAHKYWVEIPNHYPNVELDVFVVMPNHIHGIIIINNHFLNNNVVTGQCPVTTTINNMNNGSILAGQSKNINVVTGHCPVTTNNIDNTIINPYGLVSKIINAYKGCVIKEIHKKFVSSRFSWQRSFYDHVVRREESLDAIRQYIVNNPPKWEYDRNNPNRKPGRYHFEY